MSIVVHTLTLTGGSPYSALYRMNPDYNIHLVYGEQPEDEREEEWIKIAIAL